MLNLGAPPVVQQLAPPKSGHWFADLAFSRKGLVDFRTGRTITASDLTPREFAKFLGYFCAVLVQAACARAATRSAPRIWFTPERPPPWYVVWSAMALSGMRFARDERDADLAFYFEDKTLAAPPKVRLSILNGALTDISKSRVATAFEAAAGYPLRLNPEAHVGVAVEKSEENGAHDGRIVICPTLAEQGKTYQHFVDCADGETAFDFRTTIIDRKPVFVLVKCKPAAQRFSIHNVSVVYRELEDVYSEAEVELLTRFAAIMQLDWAAIDVLRDRMSGRIYVVDVNKTDTGPAVDLSAADRSRLKQRLRSAFSEMVSSAIAKRDARPY